MRTIFCLFLLATSVSAADPTYWQDVRPIMRKHCTVCHSQKNIKEREVSGKLALDSLEAIRKGGDSEVLVTGKSAESSLVTLLRHPNAKRRMPLDAEPLSDETVALLKKWVDLGAPEGTKPKEDEPAVVIGPSKTRKLDVVMASKAVLPKGVGKPNQTGPIELVLAAGPLAPVTATAFSPDGTYLAVGCYGRVTVWDLKKAAPAVILTNVLGAVNDLKFSPDGSLLVAAGGQPSARGDIRVFSTKDWKAGLQLGGHLDVVNGIAFSPDGKLLASASFDKTVRIWDLATREVLLNYGGHSDFVHAVAFGPKAEWFVTASKDRTSRLVETKTGKSILTFSGTETDILAVAVRPDGQQVVTSGLESALFWWDTKTGERIRRQAGHGDTVYEIAFNTNGESVVSAGGDKTLRIWSGKTGESVRVLSVGSTVYSASIGSDGKRVASGSFDGLVRVWDSATGRLLATLASIPGDSTGYDWVALTPEGFVNASEPLVVKGKWRVSGQPVDGPTVWKALRSPESVGKALRAEPLGEPAFAVPKP